MTKKTKKNLKFKLLTITAAIIGLTTFTGLKQQTMAMNNGTINQKGRVMKEDYFINTVKKLYKNISKRKPGDDGKWPINSPQDFQKLRETYPEMLEEAIKITNENKDEATVDKLVTDNLKKMVYYNNEMISNREKLTRTIYEYGLEHDGRIAIQIISHGGGYALPEDVVSLCNDRKANDFSTLLTEKLLGAQEEYEINNAKQASALGIPIDKNKSDVIFIKLIKPDDSIKEMFHRKDNYMGHGWDYIVVEGQTQPIGYIDGKPVYYEYYSAMDNVNIAKRFLRELVGIINEANKRLRNSQEFKDGKLEALKNTANSVAEFKNGEVNFPDNTLVSYLEVNNNNQVNLDPKGYLETTDYSTRIDKKSAKDLGTETIRIKQKELINDGFRSTNKIKIDKQNFQNQNLERQGYYNPNHDKNTTTVKKINGDIVKMGLNHYLAMLFTIYMDYINKNTPNEQQLTAFVDNIIKNTPNKQQLTAYANRIDENILPDWDNARKITKIANIQGANASSAGGFVPFTDHVNESKMLSYPPYSKHLARMLYLAVNHYFNSIMLKDVYYKPNHVRINLKPVEMINEVTGVNEIGIIIDAELFGTNFKRKEAIDRIKENRITIDVVVWSTDVTDPKDVPWLTGKDDKLKYNEENGLITHRHIFWPELGGIKDQIRRMNLTQGHESNNMFNLDTYIKYWDKNHENYTNQYIFSDKHGFTIRRKPDGSLYTEDNQIVTDPEIRESIRKYEEEYLQKDKDIKQTEKIKEADVKESDNKQLNDSNKTSGKVEDVKTENEIKTDETKKLDVKESDKKQLNGINKVEDVKTENEIKTDETKKLDVKESDNKGENIKHEVVKLPKEDEKSENKNSIIDQTSEEGKKEENEENKKE